MKKRTVKSFVCATLMVMALSVTACGSNKTLEDYMNAAPDEMKELEEQFSAASAAIDGMSISIDVKGNEFINTYVFEDESLLTDEVRENITTGLESEASTAMFEELAGQLDEAINQKSAVTLTIRYLDSQENVIGEHSYKAPEE